VPLQNAGANEGGDDVDEPHLEGRDAREHRGAAHLRPLVAGRGGVVGKVWKCTGNCTPSAACQNERNRRKGPIAVIGRCCVGLLD
jgi:hypothetical protein